MTHDTHKSHINILQYITDGLIEQNNIFLNPPSPPFEQTLVSQLVRVRIICKYALPIKTYICDDYLRDRRSILTIYLYRIIYSWKQSRIWYKIGNGQATWIMRYLPLRERSKNGEAKNIKLYNGNIRTEGTLHPSHTVTTGRISRFTL